MHSKTIVIQTFRNHNIPSWIQRCLDSVREWARSQSYDYSLTGDEFYDLCGPQYLQRGIKNPQAITNLARLIATRQHLDAGYEQVIWMDADLFVFNIPQLVFDFPADRLNTGYAFGREVWLFRNWEGVTSTVGPFAHNAATFFTKRAVDLDMLISLIRHIDAKREIVSNLQVGVRLLRGLQYSLMFPTFSHVGLFSPELLRAASEKDEKVLRFYGSVYRYPMFAANLSLSLHDKSAERMVWKVMDSLQDTAGNVINKYATEAGIHLLPFEVETTEEIAGKELRQLARIFRAGVRWPYRRLRRRADRNATS